MYKLSQNPEWAQNLDTGVWENTEKSPAYLVWVAGGNTPLPADPLPDPRIAEAKAYLLSTDYKMLPDYTVAPNGEPIADIVAKRAAARELIRSLS